jgi:hypothetical protein
MPTCPGRSCEQLPALLEHVLVREEVEMAERFRAAAPYGRRVDADHEVVGSAVERGLGVVERLVQEAVSVLREFGPLVACDRFQRCTLEHCQSVELTTL